MASRFWVTQPASAIADNGSGKCRVTVASTTGMTTGDTRLFFSFTGTTGLNGSQTITVISGTTLDVSAVAFVATGTGSINGFWTPTNTNNWVSTSGGSNYGQTVPSSADDVFLNASSGSGTITPNFGGPFTLQSLNIGALNGTFDNSVNNNNITLTQSSAAALDNNNAGTRTINLGSATYTLNAATAFWDSGSTGGLTMIATASTIAFTGTTGVRIFKGNSKTYGTISFAATSSGNGKVSIQNASGTITSLVLNAPLVTLFQSGGGANTITSLTAVGSSTAQNLLAGDGIGGVETQAPITVTNANLSWAAFRDIAFTGAPIATNSFDLGNNTGITITAPVAGGGGSSGRGGARGFGRLG